MTVHYSDEAVTLHHGRCEDVLRSLPDASVDAVVTDPPYELGFMGKGWDATGIAYNVDLWREALRVLKPGGHMLAFGGSRTWHRLASAVEDAGFEIRDSIAWLYGSGFPKSLDVSKAIDKAAGAEREVVGFDASRVRPNRQYESGAIGNVGGNGTVSDRSDNGATITAPATEDAARWHGWGTALKPAFEPIVVGRKPLTGTVAANVLEHGTGALNIDGCRVGTSGGSAIPSGMDRLNRANAAQGYRPGTYEQGTPAAPSDAGRWPTNVVLDESQAAELDKQTGVLTSGANPTRRGTDKFRDAYGEFKGQEECTPARGADSGGASRFFPVFELDHRDEDPEGECPDCQWELEQLAGPPAKPLPTFHYEAKAPTSERPRDGETAHPTVKPLDLMRWLVRLVTPPGGTVLEPFAGSGTTAEACVIEGFQCIAIEREVDYLPLIVQRLTKPIQMGFDFQDDGAA